MLSKGYSRDNQAVYLRKTEQKHLQRKVGNKKAEISEKQKGISQEEKSE